MSGPRGEGPLPDDDGCGVPPVDDEGLMESSHHDDEDLGWFAVMADSGSHWIELLNRRGNQRFYPPKEQVEDAG